MDLTQLSDEDLAVLANVGNIAAIAEQSRRIEEAGNIPERFSDRRIQDESFFAPQIPDQTNIMNEQIGAERFKDFRLGLESIANRNVRPQRTEEDLISEFLKTEGGDAEIEDIVRFQPQNIFQRSLGFLDKNPAARIGLGALLGGPVGALLGLFSPNIKQGITSLADKFRPAPDIPVMNIGDTDPTRGTTTAFGQDISAGDLSPVGNTGFSEYSSPGVAASYEGSF